MNWNDRITLLSVNPDIATPHEVARLAADLMEARRMLNAEIKSGDKWFDAANNLLEGVMALKDERRKAFDD